MTIAGDMGSRGGPAAETGTAGPVDAAGFARVSGQALDARTGRVLPDVCVHVGERCQVGDSISDEDGRWLLDLALDGDRATWDLVFERLGYVAKHVNVRASDAKLDLPITVRLVPAR